MKHDGKHFRVEAVLEAPLWLLVLIVFLVTIAVIATTLAVAQ
jgi:uncharacterized protein (DUF983 family)